jgi:uncharacterized Zn finger protein
MDKQLNRLGPIKQNLQGKACPFCGGTTYQLVLRASGTSDGSSLFVRCRQCGHPRSLDTDFKSVLWI